MNNNSFDNDKPALLKAIELILADPADIRKETLSLKQKYQKRFADDKSEDEIDNIVCQNIISNYSYYAAFVGGATLQAVKQIFKKAGITFTRKAAEKSIPFGVGVIIGFSANKGLTWYVGNKARDFLAIYDTEISE